MVAEPSPYSIMVRVQADVFRTAVRRIRRPEITPADDLDRVRKLSVIRAGLECQLAADQSTLGFTVGYRSLHTRDGQGVW